MAVYVNNSPSPLRLATGDYMYGFKSRGYYPETSDLAAYVTSGILTEYDSIPSDSELASRQPIDVNVRVNGATQASVDALQTSVNAKASQASVNAVAAEVEIVETHIHSYERWMCLLGAPVGEVNIASADYGAAAFAPFVLVDGGVLTWGAWVQILGSGDTPVTAGMVKFDLHRIHVYDTTTDNKNFKVQIAFGASGAVALAASTYTEFLYWQNVMTRSGPVELVDKQHDVGVKAWARASSQEGAGSFLFRYGIHEYPEE